MERGDILRVLRAYPDNCIRAFHCDRLLIRHYGGLVPDEIVLNYVMFVNVQDALCVTKTWGCEKLGGCTWRRSCKAEYDLWRPDAGTICSSVYKMSLLGQPDESRIKACGC
ncbi:hypothetical protein [Pantoea sp. WEP]|uniref:hypothetical protein n=1 Tax=Pantoea sp. WEP TaxID=3230025 RepID=UPI00356A934F